MTAQLVEVHSVQDLDDRLGAHARADQSRVLLVQLAQVLLGQQRALIVRDRVLQVF